MTEAREWSLQGSALAAALAAVAALCWVLSIGRMQGMDMGPGADLGSFSWFLPTWVLMMAAMMLPSALPAVVSFERGRRERSPLAQGAVFALGYLAVWTLVGVVAFLVYDALASAHPGLLDWDGGGRYLVAATAVAAGLYELTPFKRACLARCRAVGERDADGPALLAACRYGVDCVGCSAGLMLLLLVIGPMSITWMVVVAAALLLEKVPSAGPRTVLIVAVGLIALGAWIAIDPGTAPGLTVPMDESQMHSPIDPPSMGSMDSM